MTFSKYRRNESIVWDIVDFCNKIKGKTDELLHEIREDSEFVDIVGDTEKIKSLRKKIVYIGEEFKPILDRLCNIRTEYDELNSRIPRFPNSVKIRGKYYTWDSFQEVIQDIPYNKDVCCYTSDIELIFDEYRLCLQKDKNKPRGVWKEIRSNVPKDYKITNEPVTFGDI